MSEIKFDGGKENYIEGIEEEFQDLAGQLKNMDFSKESNKNFVLQTTLKNIDNEGENNMKKINKIKKTGIIAASLLLASTLVAQTTFAQDTVSKIIKSISLGHVTMFQDDYNDEPKELNLPDSLKGKVFDKNGKAIDKLTVDMYKAGIYTKSKEKIYKVDPKEGIIVTEKQYKQNEEARDKNNLCVTDSSKLNEYTCFKVKLPTYLPEGYEFEKAVFFRNKPDEKVKDRKYIDIQFINKMTGKEIYMQQRFACEETKSEGSAEQVEKIKINGVDAILSDNKNIDWEANKTLYYIGGKNIGRDEVIKVAQSIK